MSYYPGVSCTDPKFTFYLFHRLWFIIFLSISNDTLSFRKKTIQSRDFVQRHGINSFTLYVNPTAPSPKLDGLWLHTQCICRQNVEVG